MKKKRIKSAIPIYGCAALWLLMGLIFPKALLKMWFILLTSALSTVIYYILNRIFPGREIEIRDAAKSGDRNVDALIENGRGRLDSLKEANAVIADEQITLNLNRMINAGEEIFNALERDTKRAHDVRKFMNYYLPTADKLMSAYRMMMNTQSRSESMEHAMGSVKNSLEMIASAFEKQLDNLYKDRALDIDTDIDVLETMMASDGLINNESIAAKAGR